MTCSVCKGSHMKLYLVLTDGPRFYVRTDERVAAGMLSEAWLCASHHAAPNKRQTGLIP
jgi:hypothetical protein